CRQLAWWSTTPQQAGRRQRHRRYWQRRSPRARPAFPRRPASARPPGNAATRRWHRRRPPREDADGDNRSCLLSPVTLPAAVAVPLLPVVELFRNTDFQAARHRRVKCGASHALGKIILALDKGIRVVVGVMILRTVAFCLHQRGGR